MPRTIFSFPLRERVFPRHTQREGEREEERGREKEGERARVREGKIYKTLM